MDEIFDLLQPFVADFQQNCCDGSVPYEDRGITNIEGFYWWATVGLFRPDIILESGVCRGRSTLILAKAQQFFGIPEHLAFDRSDEHEVYVRSKLSAYRTRYKIKPSDEAFEAVLAKHPSKRVVAVLDGPKSGPAFERVLRAAFGFEGFCAVLVHDCAEGSGSRPLLSDICEKYAVGYRLVFSGKETNTGISFLNDAIADDVKSSLVGMGKEEKIDLMESVGICYDPRRLTGI